MKECYKCKYRGELDYSAHSCCNHPEKQQIKVEGAEHGKKMGWFAWPYNFDPVWLDSCNGFKSIEEGKR